MRQSEVCELAHRAGMSRMAFYRNYESKGEIVAERVPRLYIDYWDELAHEGRTRFVDYSRCFFAYIVIPTKRKSQIPHGRRAMPCGFLLGQL